MNFVIEPAVFEKLPTLCVGVVAAKGIDNAAEHPELKEMLQQAALQAEARFSGKKVKEEPSILPYRQAFQSLGINPNKYMCSIEALFTRIAKGKGMPSINPLVDLNNAVSLETTLPMGTHDLSLSEEDICLRFAKEGDDFLPFGAQESESPEPGEIVYAVGSQVRTRRWTWRQSENGKITEETGYVFFPIDGFAGFNDDQVRKAMTLLEEQLHAVFGCRTVTGFADREHPQVSLNID